LFDAFHGESEGVFEDVRGEVGDGETREDDLSIQAVPEPPVEGGQRGAVALLETLDERCLLGRCDRFGER
jgi:hypothetical protein